MARQHMVCPHVCLTSSAVVLLSLLLVSVSAEQKPMVRRELLQSHSPHQVAEELAEELADLTSQVRRLGQKVAKFEDVVDEKASSTMQVRARKTAYDVEATGKAVHLQEQPFVADEDEPFPIGPPSTPSSKVGSEELRPAASSAAVPLTGGDGASGGPVDLSANSRPKKVNHRAEDIEKVPAQDISEGRNKEVLQARSDEESKDDIERIQDAQAARIAAAEASGTLDAAGVQASGTDDVATMQATLRHKQLEHNSAKAEDELHNTKESAANSNNMDVAENPFPNTIQITMPKDPDAPTSTLAKCADADDKLTAACACGGEDCGADRYCLDDVCHTHPRGTACPADTAANPAKSTALTHTCKCNANSGTNECATGKYCYANTDTPTVKTCHDHAQGFDCTESFTHPLETRCQCNKNQVDNECLIGQFCYDIGGGDGCYNNAKGCHQFASADSCPYYCKWTSGECKLCDGTTIKCDHKDCEDQTTQAECLKHPCRWDAAKSECKERWKATVATGGANTGQNDWWHRLMKDREAAIEALRAAEAAEEQALDDLGS